VTIRNCLISAVPANQNTVSSTSFSHDVAPRDVGQRGDIDLPTYAHTACDPKLTSGILPAGNLEELFDVGDLLGLGCQLYSSTARCEEKRQAQGRRTSRGCLKHFT
jgi:hypothetical protein